MKKSLGFLSLSLLLFMLVMNFSISAEKENEDVSLSFIKVTSQAACEQPAVGGLPALPCYKIWCSDVYRYDGCGAGNGEICYEAKNC